jgi:hypothetical protein
MKRSILIFVLAALASLPAFASGPTYSGPQTVPVNLTVAESLTFTVSGGPLVIPPTGAPSNTINLNYSYNINPVNHTTSGLSVVAWFGSTSALTQGTATIPNTALAASLNGSGYTPCSGAASNGIGVAGSVCVANQDLTLAQITAAPSGQGSDTLAMEYVGSGTLLPGLYSGVLNVEYVIP